MGIGNIGWTEFIVILAFALIFFGPRRLPGIAQTIGKSLREFQKALNEVKSEIAQAGKEADPEPQLKRIAPHPTEYFTPDPPVADSAPAPEEPQTAEGADAGASQDTSPDEKSAQNGDS
jgi:Tat protein translocase TatB subunit